MVLCTHNIGIRVHLCGKQVDCSLGERKETEGVSVFVCMYASTCADVCMCNTQLCAHLHENAYVLIHMFMSGVWSCFHVYLWVYYCTCAYICMCSYELTCMCVCVCACLNIHEHKQHWEASSIILLISYGRDSHWTWNSLIQLGWLANELQRPSCHHLISTGITDTCPHAQL